MTQTLFSCLYGSRLYGTQTPTSDLDRKHIVLPALDDLLLGMGVKNKDKKTNTEKNVRNTQDDVDETFIPVQVFARDFYQGQTYALELAWALEGTHAEQSFYNELGMPCLWGNMQGVVPFMDFTRELRSKFLTSNIKAMMGYAVNQASLYSFKGERLHCIQQVEFLFDTADAYYGNADAKWEKEETLEGLFGIPIWKERLLEACAKFPKYFKLGEYDIGGGVMKPCFTLLEKCLPFTNKMDHTLRVIHTLHAKYGNRSAAAAATAGNDTQTVDWKATMHALRIINQGIELLSTGKMTFPFEQAYVDKLLSIKRGEVALAVVTEEMTTGLDRMKELEQSTHLQPASHERKAELDAWLVGWMRRFYNV
jgi:hypothetical protein